MSKLERIYYFHREVSLGRYPDAAKLAGHFEVSLSTAHRDIEYLRDRLNAPLVYERKMKGYRYIEGGFALPFEKSPAALFLFAVLNRLAEDSGLMDIPEMENLQKVMGQFYCADYKKLAGRIHCEKIEVEPAPPEAVRAVLMAFHNDSRLRFAYAKPNCETSFRKVDPLRLINYQGRWYLLGYCHMRGSIRMFHMARVSSPEVLEEPCECGDVDADHFLQGSFGIFKGEPVHDVKILFTDTAADVVRDQVWHKDQRMKETGDGLVLSIPAADFTEIKMKVLQYGWRARVLEPPELRRELAEEVRFMCESMGMQP
ncbi:MAG: transcriptional regulator [Desulfobacteraceae bacterium]|nr:transcriptional regulator [Desulfobacteraceae bacterium]